MEKAGLDGVAVVLYVASAAVIVLVLLRLIGLQ
jgi:hypothetical protein